MVEKPTFEDVQRLEEILGEIKDLANEAAGIVHGTPHATAAKSYWLAQILIALDGDHGYLRDAGITMQDTIDALMEEQSDD